MQVELEGRGSLTEILVTEARPDGGFVALFLDQAGTRLTELIWVPLVSLSARQVTLSAPVMPSPSAVSAAGNQLLLTDSEESAFIIDRLSGAVTPLPAMPLPAVMTPDGKALVSATDAGFVSVRLHESFLPEIAEIRPLLVLDLDTPRSLAVLPGRKPGEFTVVAGGYGCLGLMRVERLGRGPAPLSGEMVGTGGLPYDPIFIQRPTPISPAPGAQIFACDWGRAGLIAVDIADFHVEKCPLPDRDYGAVSQVVPELDGQGCLVLTRDGQWLRWYPGTEPRPMPELGGFPILWQSDELLVVAEDGVMVRGVRREDG